MTISPELLSLLDSLPDPRILVDRNYRILAANQAYRRAFGEGGNPVGKTCYAVSHRYTRPCDECGESCPLQAALKSGQSSRVLHLHHTPKGEEYVDVELAPLMDGEGRLTAFVERLHFLREKSADSTLAGMVGRAPAFTHMLELINRAAPSMTPVLLLGESGTGKELAAQALHHLSSRRDAPFVPVECSGLTESLFESELFGYEKGAFTGAMRRKTGLVEAAAGGTLFLDELGDIPLSMQVKLLRLLESGTFRRVGGVESLRADFRLVAATHRDLRAMVEAGTFRRDLYYRIVVFPVPLPALRERIEDLDALAQVLLRRVAQGREMWLNAAALERLRGYSFPGNVRELRNILERAVLLADGEIIGLEHLPEEVTRTPPAMPVGSVTLSASKPLSASLIESGSVARREAILPLPDAERRYVRWVLTQCGNDRAMAARRLGISERTLYRKLEAKA